MAVAVAQAGSCSSIQPLAWEPPYAAGAVAKRQETKKRKKKKRSVTSLEEVSHRLLVYIWAVYTQSMRSYGQQLSQGWEHKDTRSHIT